MLLKITNHDVEQETTRVQQKLSKNIIDSNMRAGVSVYTLENYLQEIAVLEKQLEVKMQQPYSYTLMTDPQARQLNIMLQAYASLDKDPKNHIYSDNIFTQDEQLSSIQEITNAWEVAQEVYHVQNQIKTSHGAVTLKKYNEALNKLQRTIQDKIKQDPNFDIYQDQEYAQKAHKLNIQDQAYARLNPAQDKAWREKLNQETKNKGKISAVISAAWQAARLGLSMLSAQQAAKDIKIITKDAALTLVSLKVTPAKVAPATKIQRTLPERYDEYSPQLCYTDEQDQVRCSVISARGEEVDLRPQTLKPAVDPLSEITQALSKTIKPIYNDKRYPEAIVYDLSYSAIRASADTANLEAAQSTLLKQQLALFDQISARFDASPDDKIKYSQSELEAVNAAFLGEGKTLQITGTVEEQVQLQQIFNEMLENRIGFERAVTLAITHLTKETRSITLNIDTDNGSHYIPDEKIVAINVNEEDTPLGLCHELNHAYHDSITRLHKSPEKFKLLMESALADHTIAYIYKYFPALRDIEKTAAQYIPTTEERENIDLSIERINNIGLGQLINNIKKSDNKLSVADMAKIIFIDKYCANIFVEDADANIEEVNIWSNPEEIFAIVGELTFVSNGQRIVLIDTQNEHEFANIAGLKKRISHTDYSSWVYQDYNKGRELLSALEKYQGSVVKDTICNHLEIELTSAKVKILIESIQYDKLPDLKCIDLSGATANSKLTIETIFDLLKIATERNIKVILPKEFNIELSDELRQEILKSISINCDANAFTPKINIHELGVDSLNLLLQTGSELVKQAIDEKIRRMVVDFIDVDDLNEQSKENFLMALIPTIPAKIQIELRPFKQEINLLIYEGARLAKQIIAEHKNYALVQKELEEIKQRLETKINPILAIAVQKTNALIEADFKANTIKMSTLIQQKIAMPKQELAAEIQAQLELSKHCFDRDVEDGRVDLNSYGFFKMIYLDQLTQDELDKITLIELPKAKIESSEENSDKEDSGKESSSSIMLSISNWFKNGKLANLKAIDMYNGEFADEFISVLIDAIAANKLPLLEKVRLDGATMSPKLRDLLDNAIDRFGAKHASFNK